MIQRMRHNRLFKLITAGLVCLFLVNTTFQGLSYADPLHGSLHPGSISPDDGSPAGRKQEGDDLRDQLKKFAPLGLSEPLRYVDLEGSFIDDLEVEADLNEPRGQRFSKGNAELVGLLEGSLGLLEDLINNSNDTNLQHYLEELLRLKEDNLIYPISIRVSERLPVNSVRYYNSETGEVEIIFSKDFITQLLRDKGEEAVKYILAERLFHELGHDNERREAWEEREEEKFLIGKDLALHQLMHARGTQETVNAYLSSISGHKLFKSDYYFEDFIQKRLMPLARANRQPELTAEIDRYLDENFPSTVGEGQLKAMAKKRNDITDRFVRELENRLHADSPMMRRWRRFMDRNNVTAVIGRPPGPPPP